MYCQQNMEPDRAFEPWPAAALLIFLLRWLKKTNLEIRRSILEGLLPTTTTTPTTPTTTPTTNPASPTMPTTTTKTLTTTMMLSMMRDASRLDIVSCFFLDKDFVFIFSPQYYLVVSTILELT